MAQKTTTIFRQLILNIILPMVVTILAFSYISYSYNHEKLEESYKNERKLIVEQVKTLISFYDYAMNMHEEQFNNRMEKVARQWREYFKKNDPATSNLYEASVNLGLDTTKEFVYIIDRNGEIINTTFKKDLHLNFYKIDSNFRTFFEKRFKDTSFLADRFGYEINTGGIKKFGYITPVDQKYIIELGFGSVRANELKKMLEKRVRNIASKFSEIRNMELFAPVLHVASHNVIDQRYNKWVDSTIVRKKNVRIIDHHKNEDLIVDFIYLPILNSSLYDAYVINIVSDDSREKELIWNEFKKFMFIFLITIIPLIIIVSYRAKVITRPIKILTEKANIISSGKLDERVNVNSNNEIGLLSANFNKMVSELEESYNTLEQKVKDRTHELNEQKNIVEEKNKEILDSINYAKRLQEAILPPGHLIQKNLPHSFVLYLPKDIVAGDFYWAEENDDYFFIASADCTGHGVPGALVSMVCSNALNRCVKEFELTNTGLILDKAKELVVETFAKSDHDVKDGMDISLAAIHKKTNTLYWSGANNPLWIARRNNDDAIIIDEIKANKQPIGQTDKTIPFTQHEIALKKGDWVYLFTDGYADQFGGERGKKFKYKQLEEYLASLYERNPEEQRKELIKTIINWMGDNEQNDDICIIGFKLN